MSTNHSFVNADWIFQGKHWSDVPPLVKRAATHAFTIPSAIEQQIIPSPNISIHQLIDFTLPKAIATIQEANIAKFFSLNEPGIITEDLLARMSRLAMPTSSVVNKLVNAGHQAWLDGFKSVKYIHISDNVSTHFPLWLITFWKEVHLLRISVRSPWVKAQGWLNGELRQKRSSERRARAEEVNMLLSSLPWGINKCGVSDNEPIHTLWRFLGPHYTTGSQQNDLLEILRCRIASDPSLVQHMRVEGVDLTVKIMKAATTRGTDEYQIEQGFAWVRSLGNDLLRREQTLLTVAHLGEDNKHWVALVVDVKDKSIRYGDSLGLPIPSELLEAYTWWLAQHSPIVFENNHLPITKQEDGSSCGTLADNCLNHFATPMISPMIKTLAIREARMSAFSCIANHVLERLEIEDDILTSQDGLSSDGIMEASPVSSVDEAHAGFKFAFSLNVPIVVPLNSTTSQHSSTTKRPNDHSNRPTPPSSPRKKRLRNDQPVTSSSPLIFPLNLNATTPPPASAPNHTGRRYPPTPGPVMVNSKLENFFKPETSETKAHKNSFDFEVIVAEREQQEFNAMHAQRQRQARQRQNDKERQQKHRTMVFDRKIAEGWVPGQKRKHFVDFEVPSIDLGRPVAELSRPRRKYKADSKSTNKPQGRKPTKFKRRAKNVNWKSPFLWSQIELAAIRAGRPWRPRDIVREVKRLDPIAFEQLTEQVLGRWIDKDAQADGISKWKDSVLAEVDSGNAPGGQSTRAGILESYPEIRTEINSRIQALRDAGVALGLIAIRGIMVASIEFGAPQLFTQVFPDGSHFRCSEEYVRNYLRALGWSERRATRAAQKLPPNHEQILSDSFLRQACIIRDHAIPAELRANTDQTQTVYQMGNKTTWNLRGVKQVSTVGMEEKRAFTLVPTITANGEILPMQAIFQGQTTASCPSLESAQYRDAITLGFKFEPSKTKTYWSTQATMKSLVNDIITPHFDKKKRELGLPPTQCSLWTIDCWSVHKSEEFRTWMKETHPTIIISFVPGGCTGLWQPLDVGIQRVLKQSMKRAAHKDIVTETMAQLDAGRAAAALKLDTTLGNLRNRSVGWLVNAYHDINRKDLIMKAFEMCRIGDFNLSHSSLTSSAALTALRELPTTNISLYHEITSQTATSQTVNLDDTEPDFGNDDETAIEEGSDIPVDVIVSHIVTGNVGADASGFMVGNDGVVVRNGAAEGIDSDGQALANQLLSSARAPVNEVPIALGRGLRAKTGSNRYGADWEQH